VQLWQWGFMPLTLTTCCGSMQQTMLAKVQLFIVPVHPKYCIWLSSTFLDRSATGNAIILNELININTKAILTTKCWSLFRLSIPAALNAGSCKHLKVCRALDILNVRPLSVHYRHLYLLSGSCVIYTMIFQSRYRYQTNCGIYSFMSSLSYFLLSFRTFSFSHVVCYAYRMDQL